MVLLSLVRAIFHSQHEIVLDTNTPSRTTRAPPARTDIGASETKPVAPIAAIELRP